jgi:hypothetical protein
MGVLPTNWGSTGQTKTFIAVYKSILLWPVVLQFVAVLSRTESKILFNTLASSACAWRLSHTVVVVVVNIFIPSGSSHAGVFPDLLTGPPFHYLSSLIRRVGSSVVPPPSLGSPRGSSRGGGGAGGLLLLLAYPYQHGCHYSRLLSRHRACQEGVEGYRGHTMPFLGYALGYLLLRTSSAYPQSPCTPNDLI